MACESGDLEFVKEFLARSPPPNIDEPLHGGVTGLMLCAQHGDDERIAIAAFLVERKANINARNKQGHTPLSFAALAGAKYRAKPMCDWLLSHGAEPSLHAQNCQNPVTCAVQSSGREEVTDVASFLLEKKGDLLPRPGKPSPLFEAAQLGRKEFVKLLLEHGADVKYTFKNATLFGAVVQKRWTTPSPPQIIDMLKQASVRLLRLRHRLCLCLQASFPLACEAGDAKLVEEWLSRKPPADVNDEVDNGYTALMLAAQRGRVDVVKLLLKHGANKQLCGNDGHTAMSLAMRDTRLPTVCALVPDVPGWIKRINLVAGMTADVNRRLREFTNNTQQFAQQRCYFCSLCLPIVVCQCASAVLE